MLAKKWILTGTCALLVMGTSTFAEEGERPPRGEGPPCVEGECGPRGEGRRGHRPPPFNEILERHDANKDGILQLSEKPERMPAEAFERIDANGDGSIDSAEGAKAREGGRRGRPSAEQMFKQMDANEDGSITLDEAKAFEAKRGEMRKEQKGQRGPRPEGEGVGGRRGPDGGGRRGSGGGGGGRRGEHRPSAEEMFKHMDANGDGVVNIEEAQAMDAKRKARQEGGGRKRGEGKPRRKRAE